MKRLRPFSRIFYALTVLLLVDANLLGREPAPGKVYVVLWFDTEDYILPQSDDAAKRLAAFLTEQGIQGTFKVVGEKARTLERRHRTDVILALQKHSIGYHSNTHSQHPTPAEYESLLDWETGAAEFTRRERPALTMSNASSNRSRAATGSLAARGRRRRFLRLPAGVSACILTRQSTWD